MMIPRIFIFAALGISAVLTPMSASAENAPLKSLGRFDGWRDNALIGYGLVVGLSGSGDSRRSGVTRQTLKNVFDRLGVSVTEEQISSRNVAVVMAIGTLPPSANVGDKISITVSSAGDARSLAGGTLLMTPMLGPDRKAYALAQGPLVTGGYNFESDANFNQRNFPTTARLEMGATIEKSVNAEILSENGDLGFLLNNPSFTTASRIANKVNAHFGPQTAWADGADSVRIQYNPAMGSVISFISKVENLEIDPDTAPRIVINERTGTIVAGGDVTISSVTISQGDINVTVTSETHASQPAFISGFASDVSSLVIRNTELSVEEGSSDVVATFDNTTVADLVEGLSDAGVNTRRLISVLQAIKAAGALHSEIIVQ